MIRFDDEGAAVLALDGVEILPLRGALAEELALLPGAFVRVHGPRSGAGVRVRSYRLLDAGDGLVPVVGELVEHQGGLWIAEPGGAAYALRGEALVRLLPMVGARVWVSGAVMDGRHFLVHRYGLLRAPPAQEGATP